MAGKLSVVFKDGRWLLYARANLKQHGGRYVVLARSLTSEPWGEGATAYAPFELIHIEGYNMHGHVLPGPACMLTHTSGAG